MIRRQHKFSNFENKLCRNSHVINNYLGYANLGRFMDTFRIGVKNLPTLAGLWPLFGVVRPSVIDLRTLAGLWTLFGYKEIGP